MDVRLDGRVGGAALVLGYLLVVALVFRDPSRGVETATVTLEASLYFLALPAGGIVAGAYALLGGPYRSVGLFAGANYLGVFGLTLAVGAGLEAGGPVRLAGVIMFALALLALIASVRAVVEHVGD